MSIAESLARSNTVQLDVHHLKGLAKLTGLIVRRLPEAGEAVMFAPCASVHSFWMRRAIDVVFCDRDGTVRSTRTLEPWRVAFNCGAHSVLELRAGEARRLGIRPGVQIRTDRAGADAGESRAQ